MEHQLSIGEQIKKARNQKKLTQIEFANKCNLNIRTIQRIEKDEVIPRLYTQRIIEDTLEIELLRKVDNDEVSRQLIKLRDIFDKRKKTRMVTFFVAIILLVAAFYLVLTGISKPFGLLTFIYYSLLI